jgi:hypothetical protein
LENIGGGFADEIWNHGRMMVAIGFVLTLLENTPVVNWFTTPGLLGLLYFQIRDNWDQLTAMAVRFVHGESTPQDQRAFGAFIAQMFAAAFGSRVGRAAVGTALPFGVGAVVAWATGGSSRRLAAALISAGITHDRGRCAWSLT